jgi:hypothetical protein
MLLLLLVLTLKPSSNIFNSTDYPFSILFYICFKHSINKIYFNKLITKILNFMFTKIPNKLILIHRNSH